MAGHLAAHWQQYLRNGYNFVPIKQGSKAPSIPAWQKVKATPELARKWLSNGHADAGIGIITGEVAFADLDTPREDIARELEDYCQLEIGIAPVRIGNFPKRGLMYRAERPIRKIASPTYVDDEGREFRAEWLGQGQQFVSHHIHPDTRKPYLWEKNFSPLEVPVADLPIVTEAQERALIAKLAEIATREGWRIKSPGTQQIATITAADDDLAGLQNEPEWGKLVSALRSFPEEARDDRDRWYRVGMILHHAYGGSEDAYTVWCRWSEKSYKFDPVDQRRVWESFGRYNGAPLRIGSLYELAKTENGWTWPAETPSPSRLKFLAPSDCAAEPRRGHLVKGLIAPGDVGCIFGPPGAGKSALAPLIGYHVALGETVFGLRTTRGGVLYVAAEDPTGMASRIAALKRRYGDAPAFTLAIGLSDLLADNSPDRAALLDAIGQRQPSLVFLDTMAMAFPGLDENDAKDMGRAVRFTRSIAEHGPAVVLIHHGTKADGSTPRGHSVLNGALDTAMQIMPSERSDVIRAKLTKNRNGPCNLDIAFRIGAEELGVDEDGDAITAAIAEALPPGTTAPKSGLTKTGRQALAIFEELYCKGDGVTESAWRAACISSNRLSGSDDPKSHRRAFERARLELTREKIILIEGEIVLPHHDFE